LNFNSSCRNRTIRTAGIERLPGTTRLPQDVTIGLFLEILNLLLLEMSFHLEVLVAETPLKSAQPEQGWTTPFSLRR
jgi:hypothetical protein